MADEDASQGYYIYCVIQTAGDRSFPVMSMDGDTHGVTTIRFMDLAAVVSPASEASYAVTRQHTLAHQLVLEAVMQEFTLLPVRFGTVALQGGRRGEVAEAEVRGVPRPAQLSDRQGGIGTEGLVET